MCGRAYETYTAEELYFRYLNKQPLRLLDFKPNYNVSPTQTSPVLRRVDGARQFDLMRWQLVPVWEPAFSTKLSTINAKSETIFESRLYRKIIAHQRCIVPLSGFYEWKKDGAGKRPFKIHLSDEPIMGVAGIWDSWHRGSPEEGHSFSILTTSANEFMSDIHERMPVILSREDEDAWLDPEIHEQEELRKLMKPCPSSRMAAAEVSTLVNSPRNNSADILPPLADAPLTD